MASKERGGNRHPSRPACLGHRLRNAPSLFVLVNVAPGKAPEFVDAHSGRVEHEERQLVDDRDRAIHGEHVIGGGRIDFESILGREFYPLVSCRVWHDAAEVEDHCEC